jgi:hypothetical protein
MMATRTTDPEPMFNPRFPGMRLKISVFDPRLALIASGPVFSRSTPKINALLPLSAADPSNDLQPVDKPVDKLWRTG